MQYERNSLSELVFHGCDTWVYGCSTRLPITVWERSQHSKRRPDNRVVEIKPIVALTIRNLQLPYTLVYVHQVLLYVNSIETLTGMKNTGLKMPEKDQIYV